MIIITKKYFLSFLILVFILAGLSFVSAWTGPSSAPPNGNVSAPINVGTTDQVKNSGLGINSLAVFGNALLSGTSRYLNFGATAGSGGYGIRDNAGVMEVKDVNGSWARFATTTGQQLTGNKSKQITTYSTPGTFTWTKPTNLEAVHIQCIGAGGSGGRNVSGCGGGGGAYVSGWILASEVPSTVTVTIGSGGPGRNTNGNGTAGGTSSFGTQLISTGGAGGGARGVYINSNGQAATDCEGGVGGTPSTDSSVYDVEREPGGAGGRVPSSGNCSPPPAGWHESAGGGACAVPATAVHQGADSQFGGDGGDTSQAGTFPGGGGGGGSTTYHPPAGAGANGQCIVTAIIQN